MTSLAEIAATVSIVGVFITAVALLFTVKSFQKQLQLNFFSEYTKRYQEITLNFPESINAFDFNYETLSDEKRDKTLRYMRAYFDLCSEEYYLYKKKYIDKDTWEDWESGMKFAFSKTSFQYAWQKLELDTIYYGEFSKFVSENITHRNISSGAEGT